MNSVSVTTFLYPIDPFARRHAYLEVHFRKDGSIDCAFDGSGPLAKDSADDLIAILKAQDRHLTTP
jgi:hypothetical protein